jgi:PRTRC genetic system protein C
MALQVTGLIRKFTFERGNKTITLDDPNPSMRPEEVLKHYSPMYGELTNASVKGPKVEGGSANYSFTTTVGTKG